MSNSRSLGLFYVVLGMVLISQGIKGQSRLSRVDSIKIVDVSNQIKEIGTAYSDSALSMGFKMLKLAKEHKSNYLSALCFDRISLSFLSGGDMTNSLVYLDSAIRLSDSKPWWGLRAEIYLHLGGVYIKEGDAQELGGQFDASKAGFERSLEAFQKAYPYALRSGDSALIAGSLYNISVANYSLYQDSLALVNLKLAAKIFRRIGDTSILTGIWDMMGTLYDDLGMEDSVLYFYNLVRDHSRTNLDLETWRMSNVNLADVYLEIDPTYALELLHQSDSLANITGNMVSKMRINENLHYHYNRMGNDKLALKHLQKFVVLKDSILNRDFKMEELNVRYETAKQKEQLERERALVLEQELALLEAETQRQRLRLIAFGLTIVLILSLLFFQWRQRSRKIIEAQKEALSRQKLLELEQSRNLDAARAMLAGQEKERVRIAEDLHDRLGSTLAAARMQVEAAGSKTDRQVIYLEKTQSLLDRAIEDTREISHNMISGVLVKLGLSAALQDLKESMEVTNKLQLLLCIEDEPALEKSVQLNIFRIIQELVSNAVKHSGADSISIEMKVRDENMEIKLEDNGSGFVMSEVEEGLGFQNIHRRIETIGGTLKADSALEKGTKFFITLPLV